MKFRDFVDSKNVLECLSCLNKTLTVNFKKLLSNEDFIEDLVKYYYSVRNYLDFVKISTMDSIQYTIQHLDEDLKSDLSSYLLNGPRQKKERPQLFSALLNVIDVMNKLTFKYRKSYDYNKQDFVNLKILIEQLDKFYPNLNTTFYEMLTCFDGFWYIDSHVDWRPNETTPEDYYAL